MGLGLVVRSAIAGAIFLFPNVVYWAASYLGIGRDIVNIDYALPIVMACRGWLPAAIFVGVFVAIVDIFALLIQVFPFIRLTDAFYFLGMANLASPSYQLGVCFAFLIPIILLIVVLLFAKRQSLLTGMAFFNICFLGYAGVVNFDKQEAAERYWRVSGDLFGSASLYFVKHRMGDFVQGNLKSSVSFEKVLDERVVEKRLAGNSLEPIIVFIINESWGVPVNRQVQEIILKPISEFLKKEGVYGESRFTGATVSAELKELCGLMPDTFALRYAEKGLDGCLPKQYREHGYKTYALHGAMGVTYDRKDWYPKVGFENVIFYESRKWPRRCFSFPGACDIDVAREVEEIITSGVEKKFIYWLTLNSHSIYDERDIILPVDSCAHFGLQEFPQSCRNAQLQQQFFMILASILDGYEGGVLRVIVVGDHEPPILNQVEKNAVYIRGKVPWVDIVARGLSG